MLIYEAKVGFFHPFPKKSYKNKPIECFHYKF